MISSDNRFSFSVDLSTFDDKYRVPGTGHDQGYQLMIVVRDEDYRFGTCLLTYYLVDGAVGDLIAAKAAANAKVQANYTTASWAILTTALALPETTTDEIVAKTAAINNAIAGLVSVTSGGGSSGGGSSSSGAPTTPTAPPTTTTPPTTTDGTTTASTSTTAALDSATGKATAPVSTTAMEAMITQAKTAEAAGQKAVVEIKVEAAPEAKAVEIAIPKTSIMNLATETQANVTVNTVLATVTFDNKVLQTISNAASTGDVSISVASVDAGSLSPQALAVVADRPVYNFSVKAGDTEISSFEGGKARLSIPYTPKPGEKEEAIVVYYIDNNQNLIAVRGAFNPATNTVDFETTHFSIYAIGYNDVSFEDVKDTDWYSNAIGFLAARDIVKGVESGRFGPTQQMTRGQFVVMMMKAYGIDPEQNPTINFADAGNTYYTNYLAAAKNLKIVSGIGDNMYAPERFITRQEMFTMLYNALKVIEELPEGSGDRNLESFSDADGIASWAKPAIKLFVETGTVSGSNGLLRPLATSSRAEMAQVLYNLLHG
ncbi:MAG: S-layer homology domain-containing protein [Syntrophomonadaceae bacterium]|nr:S-layer homology domain-containing protein [Syntrophomonadaceae bacterium]